MAKKNLKSAAPALVTRQELAAAMGVTAGTITRWENDGMPVAQKVARGRPTRFDLEAVREWRAAMDEIEGVKEPLSLEYERARLARAQAEKTERENLVRAGQLVERETVILEGQSYTKAWTAKVRSLPKRARQIGAVSTPEAVAKLEVLVREILVDISGWRDMAATKKAAKVGARG